MIIHIKLPAGSVCRTESDLVNDFLHKIFEAYRSYSHKIVMERDLVRAFQSTVNLGLDDLNILNRLHRSYTMDAQLVSDIYPHITIDTWGTESEFTLTGFRIGAKRIVEMNVHQKTRLVVENASKDGPLYEQFIRAACADQRIGPISMEIVNGGGSGLPDEFGRQLHLGYIAVTVFDSDRKFPGDRSSEKLAACSHQLASSVSKLGLFVELPCQEIENMIPYSAIEHIVPNIGLRLRTLREIESKEEQSKVPLAERFRLYFDYKCGAKYYDGSQPHKINTYLFNLRKLSLGNFDLSKNTFSGFGEHLLDTMMKNGKYIATLRRELRTCKYWNEIIRSEIFKIAPYLIGGDRPQSM